MAPDETGEVEWTDGRVVGVSTWRRDGPMLVFAHGAGTDRDHPLVVGTAAGVASHGISVVTFDFPFRAEGRRWPPDRMDVLIGCLRSVVEWASPRRQAFVGGRSLGGRVATLAAAEGLASEGLVCHAYPLHPRGRPERTRAAHLGEVSAPILFVRGSRDELATDEPFGRLIRPLPGATVVDLDGVDHSFRARAGGDDPVARAADATAAWILDTV